MKQSQKTLALWALIILLSVSILHFLNTRPTLEKEVSFSNFLEAMRFANRVGGLAEEVNHHPEIRFSWGWVKLIIYTHKIDGLTESDFVWAAKADQLAN